MTGHSQTGIARTDGFMYSLMRGYLQLGYMVDDTVIDIVPVDYVSKAILHLSRQSASLGRVFHLNNPHPLSAHGLADWFRSLGYQIELVSANKFLREINRVELSPSDPLYPFLPLIQVGEAFQGGRRRDVQRPGCQNTLDGLAGTSIVCPPVDAKLLDTYYSYSVRSGFLDVLQSGDEPGSSSEETSGIPEVKA